MRAACAAALLALATACASEAPAPGDDSLVPGSIGVAVRRDAAGVVVSAVRRDGPAAAAGLRPGDVVLRYNGEAISDARQFHRLVIDSRPGSIGRIELLRDGAWRSLEVRVRELDLAPGA